MSEITYISEELVMEGNLDAAGSFSCFGRKI